jgi:hypothetical protein
MLVVDSSLGSRPGSLRDVFEQENFRVSVDHATAIGANRLSRRRQTLDGLLPGLHARAGVIEQFSLNASAFSLLGWAADSGALR